MARQNISQLSAKKASGMQLSEKMREFAQRKRSTGVVWSGVSALSIRCALHAALSEEVAVMFSPAAGGLGVCVTVFQDGQRHKEYAMTAEELSLILDGIAAAFGSGAEDLRVAMAGGAE